MSGKSRIDILYLDLEGFGSVYSPVRINFKPEESGVVLVEGENGSGKTTVFSGLCWALIKTTLKGSVPTWERLRDKTFQGTKAGVCFRKEGTYYYVARHLKYRGKTFGYTGDDKMMVFEHTSPDFGMEHLLTTEKHKGDMQEYVEKLIGCSAKTFLNSVVFGQRMARLVKADNKDKRELLEDIFDSDFIPVAKANAEAARGTLMAELTKEQGKLAELEKGLIKLQAQQEQEHENLKQREQTKARRITELEEDIKSSKEAYMAANDTYTTKVDAEEKKNEELAKASKELADKTADRVFATEAHEKYLERIASTEAEIAKVTGFITTAKAVIAELVKKVGSTEASIAVANKAVAEYAHTKELPLPAFERIALEKEEQDIIEVIKGLEKQANDREASLAKLQKELKLYEDELAKDAATCFECGQKVSKKHIQDKAKIVKELIKLLEADPLDKPLKEQRELLEAVVLSIDRVCYEDAITEQATLEAELLRLKKQIVIAQGNLEDAEKELTTLQASLNKETETALSVATTAFETASKEVTRLTLELEALDTEIENCTNNFKRHKKTFDDKTKTLAELKEEKYTAKDFKKELDELEKTKATLVSAITRLEEKIKKYDWWIGTAFAARGLKSYIFASMLGVLNQAVKKYAARMGIGVEFGINTELASKPFVTKCYKNGYITDYADLSGGQQQRADLCLAFAMHDVVASSVDISCLILDEAFEGLDERGLQDAYDLIRLKTEGRRVFIISHVNNSSALYSSRWNAELNEKEHTIYNIQ